MYNLKNVSFLVTIMHHMGPLFRITIMVVHIFLGGGGVKNYMVCTLVQTLTIMNDPLTTGYISHIGHTLS